MHQSKKEEVSKNLDVEVKDHLSILDLTGKDQSHLNVEVEVIYLIGVEVQGKGKDYLGLYEFHPHDNLDQLRYKVPFFKTFAQRGYELVEKES